MRETLAEAYRGRLALVQSQLTDQWNQRLTRMDGTDPPTARFARCVRGALAESAICFDGSGGVDYPGLTSPTSQTAEPAAALEAQVRALAIAGDAKALARFVLDKFPAADTTADEQGRLVSANAELLALEELKDPKDADFQKIAGRLSSRAGDYGAGSMPAAQRRFIMHAMQRLDPARQFPLLAAEDLAAQFLEANPAVAHNGGSILTEVHDVWSVASTGGQTLALFSTEGLRATIGQIIRDPSLPPGIRLAVEAPGEDSADDSVLARAAAGPALPGWRLLLSIDDRALFDTETARRVNFLIFVACVVIAAISALSILIATNFGRQARLARMKNDLVATVSHELKTPLTAMRALVDTLIDTERLDEKTTRDYLQLIATENARLSRLIGNFLTFSRLERNMLGFDFKPVSPHQIVDAAVAAFGERAHAPGCTLEAGAEPNLAPISADPDAMTTALLNLLDNAWKYTGPEKHISVRATQRNGTVCFAVADNGIGLTPGESRRIFRQFYQSDQRLARSAGGCGLGLSIVRSIVEAHRGVVRVASEPGRGSTFTIEIPA